MNLELSPSVKYWLNFFHPIVMWALLLLSLYAAYLGLQVQRTRNAQGEEKKELIKGRYNIRHHQIGSILLAFMVTGSVGGMAVTYINNGKLFVGPHLLAGLGMMSLIAFSASLSPYMQKGANWARATHILLNFALLGIFAWQAITGVQIVQKILTQA
jgi:protein-S-isoprenylcysteine O-methyltransferase Ste14